MSLTRRHWVSACLGMAALPEALSAQSPHLEVLEAAFAAEIEAIAAQIIPSTGGPGAREAGVIYFIDRALATFAAGDRQTYDEGMAQFQQKRKELFPGSLSISSLTGEQQIALIRALDASPFFELLRTHTAMAFLGNPGYGGNRGETGWKQIGFDDRMAYQPPFGYYDAQVGTGKGDDSK